MDPLLDLVYALALAIALWGTGIALGLSNAPGAIVAATTPRRRFARLVAVNVVAVPLFVVALVRVLAIPDGYATGLLLVGAASAGPLGLLVSRRARADMPLAIGLVVTLEASNILAMPAWSAVALSQASQPPIGQIVLTLVAGVLVPLAIGFAIRRRRPARVAGWAAISDQVGAAALVVVIAVVILRDVDVLLGASASGIPLVAGAVVLAGLGSGWIAGGPERGSRATGAIVTSLRANAPALAVASTSFGAHSDATAAVVAFALVSLTIVPVAGAALGRSAAARRFAEPRLSTTDGA